MTDRLCIVLPYPVSANAYWHPVRIGQRITIVPTKEAKDYREVVASHCRVAGIRQPMQGRLVYDLKLWPWRPLDWEKRIRKHGHDLWDDTVRCIDVGNAEKVLSDALQGIAFEDDVQLWRHTHERMEPDAYGARIMVTIDRYPTRPTPQPALIDAPPPVVVRRPSPAPAPAPAPTGESRFLSTCSDSLPF